jgi:hypothetical protein
MGDSPAVGTAIHDKYLTSKNKLMKVTNASVHVDVQFVKLDPAGTRQPIGLERLATTSGPDLRMHTRYEWHIVCSTFSPAQAHICA